MKSANVNKSILTPVEFLTRSLLVYPDKKAVVYKGKSFTYKEFAARVYRLANALREKGVGKGDKVAFICPNIPPMLEAHYAVPMIGAALVSVNIRLSSAEVSYIVDHSDAKVLVVDSEFASLVEPQQLPKVSTYVTVCDINQDIAIEGSLEYESFLESAPAQAPVFDIDSEDQLLAINYTSGTTGRPKGVMYSHRGAYLNAIGEILESGMTAASAYLWTLPMFHCNGWCFTWGVTAAGATHVCLRAVVAEDIFRLIDQERVTHLCAAPTILIIMSSWPKAAEVELKNPLRIMTAGAPPAPAIIRNMEKIGAQITHTYGLTEVYGPHSVCAWQPTWDDMSQEELAEIKSRQGVPYIVTHYMDVVDPGSMTPVPRDGVTMGEIVMRGNNVMSGYYKDEEATAAAFAGGWFHSGDLAVMHPDNYVQIMDRKKDIIISGGENISTVEVENVIYSHPDVLEVAVIPVPDERWGEVPKAYVVAKPGTNPQAEDIINFTKERLARFKAPKYVEFGELPKTATGKIQKFKLREKEWKGKKRVN
ncbi:acyl--CoA ligase family protein [Desulforhopalus singaporensis]|uniref:Fatty-acyl-CoA synthase n=1 Tax=Desulforhopalus singaporensis TaxID=91360 RepID=A0A1H0QDC3_9BACT|nr:acyl--CoA ligase family protein [Desulforhopalus singaporensis]SDP14696.1 fatty-acyl-CoA synthase [Desulforhopalus singaporensis]